MTEFSNIEEYISEEDFGEKSGKGWKGKLTNFLNGKYFIPAVLVLIAIIAFTLGRISGLEDKRPPVRVINNNGEVKGVSINNLPNPPYVKEGTGETTQSVVSSTTSSGQVVASKNGTKYHYPWCAGAKQISPQNLITFNSIEEARAAGYTPASNCKGLK